MGEIKVPYTPLYLERPPQTTNIRRFIRGLFKKNGTKYWLAKPTYKDKKCIQVDYKRGRRSFEDIYCIVKTYIEDATPKEVAFHLGELVKSGEYSCNLCSTAGNIVFYDYKARYGMSRGKKKNGLSPILHYESSTISNYRRKAKIGIRDMKKLFDV
jgi:hypothetical protein